MKNFKKKMIALFAIVLVVGMVSTNVFADSSWSKTDATFGGTSKAFRLYGNSQWHTSQLTSQYTMTYSGNKYSGKQKMRVMVHYPDGSKNDYVYEGTVTGANKKGITGSRGWPTTGGPTKIKIEYSISGSNKKIISSVLTFGHA